MKNVISIVSSKPSHLEFELDINGMSPSKMKVRLCIETKTYSLSFECKKATKGVWKCDVPALEHLEKGAYPFYVESIADGYYFEIVKGVANVSGSFDVYATAPKKVGAPAAKKTETIKDNNKKETKKVDTKEAASAKPTKPQVNEKTVNTESTPSKFEGLNDIADKIMGGYKKKTKKIAEKKTATPAPKKVVEKAKKEEKVETPATSTKDDVVAKILKETKNSKTTLPKTAAKKKVDEKKPIIEKTKPVEKKDEVVVEKAKEKETSQKDEKVVDILKEFSTKKQKKVAEKTESVVHFQKGKRVVH